MLINNPLCTRVRAKKMNNQARPQDAKTVFITSNVLTINILSYD